MAKHYDPKKVRITFGGVELKPASLSVDYLPRMDKPAVSGNRAVITGRISFSLAPMLKAEMELFRQEWERLWPEYGDWVESTRDHGRDPELYPVDFGGES